VRVKALLFDDRPALPIARAVHGRVYEWDESLHPRHPTGAPAAQGGEFAPKGDAAASPAVIDSPEFKRWFGLSKVVDEQGRPLIVYKAMHPYDWTKESGDDPGPEIKSINRTTEFPAFNRGEPGVRIAGFFGDKATANRFTGGSKNSAIFPVYLSLQTPYMINAQGAKAGEIQFGETGRAFRDAIRSGKYDGVIIRNTADEGDVYVALRPTQIKSAISNRGTFDPGNPDIVFSMSAGYATGDLKTTLDALEAKARAPLRDALEQSRDALLAKVRSAKDLNKLLRGLTLPREALILMEARAMLDRAWDAGQRDARAEVRLRKYDATTISSFIPHLAVSWLRSYAFYITGLIADKIIGEAKGIILNGIKTGKASSVISAELLETFLPFLGDNTVLKDARVLTPHRLETIVRTNTTAAYNHGRLTYFMDKDVLPFLKGVRYSAILDERTTPVCNHLHGKVFKPSDPNLLPLLPPNHFSCRSVVVPIVAGEPIDASEFITPSEIGKARELADAKFLSEKDDAREYAWDESKT
jgi:SPP1 gp7 family putative phage head morphogenesis protein